MQIFSSLGLAPECPQKGAQGLTYASLADEDDLMFRNPESLARALQSCPPKCSKLESWIGQKSGTGISPIMSDEAQLNRPKSREGVAPKSIESDLLQMIDDADDICALSHSYKRTGSKTFSANFAANGETNQSNSFDNHSAISGSGGWANDSSDHQLD